MFGTFSKLGTSAPALSLLVFINGCIDQSNAVVSPSHKTSVAALWFLLAVVVVVVVVVVVIVVLHW